MKRKKGFDRILRISAISCICAFLTVGGIAGVKAILPSKDDGMLVFKSDIDGNAIGRSVKLKEENFWGDGERHMRVRNQSDFPVYVKVTPYFTARDSSGEVCDCIVRDEDYLDLDLESWIKIGGSYYFRMPLEGNRYTPFLIRSCRTLDTYGRTVAVRFEISGIDAQDVKSVRDRWKVSVTDEGVIDG